MRIDYLGGGGASAEYECQNVEYVKPVRAVFMFHSPNNLLVIILGVDRARLQSVINPHGFPKYLLADAHVTITYITCLLCSCDCSFDQTSEPCSLDLIDRRIAAKFSRGLLSGVGHLFKMGKELKPVKMLFRSLTFFF